MKLRKLDIPYAMPKLLLRLHLRVALSLTNTVLQSVLQWRLLHQKRQLICLCSLN